MDAPGTSRTLGTGQFYGRIRKRQDVNGIHLSEHFYAPDLAVPRHLHKHAYVCFLIAGGYMERTLRGTRDCTTESLLFHPAGEEHEDRFAPSGGRILHVELPPRIVDHARALGLAPAFERPAPAAAPLIARRLRRELHEWDSASPLAVEGLAFQLVAELARPDAHVPLEPPWLARVLDLLHAHFRDHLTLTEVARQAGVDPAHLARAFRRHRRCTLGEHVRRLRIDYACRALLATNASLAQIALDAGFSDHAHFTRTFRRLVGTTPSAYRACR